MATTVAAPRGEAMEEPGRQERLFVPWLLISGLCLVWMWVHPGGEVVPFHLIWILFALAYGFEPWPVRRAVVALGLLSLLSGAILVRRAAEGVIAWEETFEIGLMLFLALLVLGHVQRRQAALATVTRWAEARVSAARERERLARLTSHEMRTPLAIATGYVDLLLRTGETPHWRKDLEVVQDELGRLARAGDRLLRMIRLQDLLDRADVDLAELVSQTVDRWSVVADRDWQAEGATCVLEASPERLRACVDTLIENAVRHTHEGGTVRVFCSRHGDSLLVGVADSGPGFSLEQRRLVNAISTSGQARLSPATLPQGRHTGFGLGIVQQIVQARQGVVRAGTSREGGALVVIALPGAPSSSRPGGRPRVSA